MKSQGQQDERGREEGDQKEISSASWRCGKCVQNVAVLGHRSVYHDWFLQILTTHSFRKKIIVVAKQFIINSFSVINLLYTLYVYSITIL